MAPAGRDLSGAVLLWLALAACGDEASGPVAIVLDPGVEPGLAVAVVGIDHGTLAELAVMGPADPAWPDVLSLRTSAAARRAHLPAVAGIHSVAGRRVRFVPSFPLVAGEDYVATWRGLDGGAPVELEFSMPAPPLGPSTRVEAIYPTTASPPANLLRFYIQFDGAMSRGSANRFVRLVREDGSEVEGAFVAPETELWSRGSDRLTLILDPGRIKRAVGPNMAVGPPLEARTAYRLIVEADWPDAAGRPLGETFEKRFHTVDPDRDSIRPGDWSVEAPGGGRDELRLSFPEPLDRALLARMLTVVNAEGAELAGEGRIDREETRWSWRPADPWAHGRHAVRVDAALEDLAGNSVGRLFDAVVAAEPGGAEGAFGAWVEVDFIVPGD